jgi:hypothetical protein
MAEAHGGDGKESREGDDRDTHIEVVIGRMRFRTRGLTAERLGESKTRTRDKGEIIEGVRLKEEKRKGNVFDSKGGETLEFCCVYIIF